MYNIITSQKPLKCIIWILVFFLLGQILGTVVFLITKSLLFIPDNSYAFYALMTSIVSIFTFWVCAWAFSRVCMKGGMESFSFGEKGDAGKYMKLVFFMMLLAIPISIYLGELNKLIPFPDFMSGVKQWLDGLEENSMAIISSLVDRPNFGLMLINLVIIAVIPAVGEELVFRGIIQRMIYNKNRSIHKAIWLTAVIFSVMHFEFSGLLPRVLLGAILGYIYYWTGSLWMSIWAHFINNGTLVVLAYLSAAGYIDVNVIENDIPMAKLSGYMMMAVVLIVPAIRSLYSKRKQFDTPVVEEVEVNEVDAN